jgi:hypothetical protein
MIVPIDAWNRMLVQLGNLHEAGQQLAEARERAAKAETEARFLRERLSEMRVELARDQEKPRPVVEPARPAATPSTAHRGSLWWGLYRRWADRRRR